MILEVLGGKNPDLFIETPTNPVPDGCRLGNFFADDHANPVGFAPWIYNILGSTIFGAYRFALSVHKPKSILSMKPILRWNHVSSIKKKPQRKSPHWAGLFIFSSERTTSKAWLGLLEYGVLVSLFLLCWPFSSWIRVHVLRGVSWAGMFSLALHSPDVSVQYLNSYFTVVYLQLDYFGNKQLVYCFYFRIL